MSRSTLDRREFARLFTVGGSAALLGHPLYRGIRPSPLEAASLERGAVDWGAVREQFLMPPELCVLNAANLCPSSAPVLKTMYDLTERLDRDPIPTFRDEMHGVKEPVRVMLAHHFRVPAEDILITRNTSEGNNWVSSGLDLGPGDEVLIFSDNHPSNNQAWKAKAERFGYAVREVEQVNPHPGFEYYVDAFEQALTPATQVVAFTHLTNTAGDLFPAEELCRMAHDRGVLTLVDGAQSFGLLDVDLSRMQPDFFTGSAHKWPCGPKENGVLYVNPRVQDRLWPSIYSAYVGRTGLSRTHEAIGQRDEPAIKAFGTCVELLGRIGQAEIEARSRALTLALVEGLQTIPGIHLWTSPNPKLHAAVVSFDPAGLDPQKVLPALAADGIVATARGGDRAGIRFSPHFYNSFQDVDRAVSAIQRYVRSGL